MDLSKHGKLLRDLRKQKDMTQKEVAEKLGILPKTVSKWETGHGFPDVSVLSALADVLGVSERLLLLGNRMENKEEVGNMKRAKFYVCPHCHGFMLGVGEGRVVCCGKTLEPLSAKMPDDEHSISLSEVEDEFYLEFSHEMRKEHYISFVSYVGFDRMVTVKLYPEQDAALRLPRRYDGKIVYYCNQDGLFEYPLKRRK